MYFSDDEINISQEGAFGIWECVSYSTARVLSIGANICTSADEADEACG